MRGQSVSNQAAIAQCAIALTFPQAPQEGPSLSLSYVAPVPLFCFEQSYPGWQRRFLICKPLMIDSALCLLCAGDCLSVCLSGQYRYAGRGGQSEVLYGGPQSVVPFGTSEHHCPPVSATVLLGKSLLLLSQMRQLSETILAGLCVSIGGGSECIRFTQGKPKIL